MNGHARVREIDASVTQTADAVPCTNDIWIAALAIQHGLTGYSKSAEAPLVLGRIFHHTEAISQLGNTTKWHEDLFRRPQHFDRARLTLIRVRNTDSCQ